MNHPVEIGDKNTLVERARSLLALADESTSASLSSAFEAALRIDRQGVHDDIVGALQSTWRGDLLRRFISGVEAREFVYEGDAARAFDGASLSLQGRDAWVDAAVDMFRGLVEGLTEAIKPIHDPRTSGILESLGPDIERNDESDERNDSTITAIQQVLDKIENVFIVVKDDARGTAIQSQLRGTGSSILTIPLDVKIPLYRPDQYRDFYVFIDHSCLVEGSTEALEPIFDPRLSGILDSLGFTGMYIGPICPWRTKHRDPDVTPDVCGEESPWRGDVMIAPVIAWDREWFAEGGVAIEGYLHARYPIHRDCIPVLGSAMYFCSGCGFARSIGADCRCGVRHG